MISAKELNQLWVEQVEDNKEKYDAMTLVYVRNMAKEKYPNAKDISVELNKTANIITMKIAATVDGKRFEAVKEWTDAYLRTLDTPIPALFDEVLDECVRSPMDKAPLS